MANPEIPPIVLSETNFYFVDGTFKTSPKLFKQVLNFMAEYKGKVVPVFHCTLTSKSRALYIAVLEHLVQKFPQFKPQTIMSDFEASLTLALREIFPRVRIAGCRFHFGQVK